MIVEQSKSIIAEVNKALVGKQDVVEKALMAIYAGGHILLEDVPRHWQNHTGASPFESA